MRIRVLMHYQVIADFSHAKIVGDSLASWGDFFRVFDNVLLLLHELGKNVMVIRCCYSCEQKKKKNG